MKTERILYKLQSWECAPVIPLWGPDSADSILKRAEGGRSQLQKRDAIAGIWTYTLKN